MINLYILKRKKHNRMVLFKNNEESIDFIKQKFHGKTKIIYALLKLGILQRFLKKIDVNTNIDVIFVANQIKLFNLDKKTVTSFPMRGREKEFVIEKSFQEKLGREGIAPEVVLNKKIPYSVERLLKPYTGNLEYAMEVLSDFQTRTGIYHQDIIDDNGDIVKEHIFEDNGRIKFIDWGIPK